MKDRQTGRDSLFWAGTREYLFFLAAASQGLWAVRRETFSLEGAGGGGHVSVVLSQLS